MTKLAKAHEHAEICEKQYNDYVNLILRTGDDWDLPLLISLRDRANRADEAVFAARVCKHENVSMVGGQHFDAGEVDDNIKEVCQDCGKVVSDDVNNKPYNNQ